MDATINMSNIFDHAVYNISFPGLVFLIVPKKLQGRDSLEPHYVYNNMVNFVFFYSGSAVE